MAAACQSQSQITPPIWASLQGKAHGGGVYLDRKDDYAHGLLQTLTYPTWISGDHSHRRRTKIWEKTLEDPRRERICDAPQDILRDGVEFRRGTAVTADTHHRPRRALCLKAGWQITPAGTEDAILRRKVTRENTADGSRALECPSRSSDCPLKIFQTTEKKVMDYAIPRRNRPRTDAIKAVQTGSSAGAGASSMRFHQVDVMKGTHELAY